eukprot:m.95703 g.95703  ORF g.95703 m.95703 type:complete len:62 (+) comp12444_c0_seq3:855-1040(+)
MQPISEVQSQFYTILLPMMGFWVVIVCKKTNNKHKDGGENIAYKVEKQRPGVVVHAMPMPM